MLRKPAPVEGTNNRPGQAREAGRLGKGSSSERGPREWNSRRSRSLRWTSGSKMTKNELLGKESPKWAWRTPFPLNLAEKQFQINPGACATKNSYR
jgi:hypothetical protein